VFEAGIALQRFSLAQCRQESVIGRYTRNIANPVRLETHFCLDNQSSFFKKKPTTCHSKKMSLNVWNEVMNPSPSHLII
jgi:hypothetical protein